MPINSCKEDSAQWRALPAQFAQQWVFGRAAQSSALARWSWSPFCTTFFPDKTRATPRPSIASCRTCLRCYQGTVISVMRAMSSSSKVSNIGTYARVTIKFKMIWKDKSSWPSWIHLPRSAVSQFIQLLTRIPKFLPLICDSVGRLCNRCSCDCFASASLYVRHSSSLFCHMLTICRCFCWSLRLSESEYRPSTTLARFIQLANF